MIDTELTRAKLLIARFLESIAQQNFSRYTIRNYRHDLGVFLCFLCGEDVEALANVTPTTLHQYQTHLYAKKKKGGEAPLSLNTQCARLTAVRSWFRWLTQRGFVMTDPASGLTLPKQKRTIPHDVPTRQEVEKILNQPNVDTSLGFRDKTILEILYSTGIRNGELLNLAIHDVDVKERELRVRCGKGQKDRVVPLGDIAAHSLTQYLDHIRPVLAKRHPENSQLFLSCNGLPLSGCVVNDLIVKKYVRRAKLAKHITPHSFRHACATHMLKNRANIRHIQALLGHKSLETTQIYTRVEVGDLKREHRRTHPREQIKR